MPRTPPPLASVLWSVGDRLSRAVDVDSLLNELAARIASTLGADRGTIYLLDPASGELCSRGARLPALGEIRLKLGQGVAGTVAATGETLNLPDAGMDKRVWRKVDEQTGYKTRTLLATPLFDNRQNVIGVVQVLNARRGRFQDEDAATLRRLAAEVAVAIENTSLYQPSASGVPAGPREPRQSPAPRYNGLVGHSPAMQELYRGIARAAPTDASVLIRGESGTGKALVARALHDNGKRHAGPFVTVDCTTIPESLMESALFGHERGAFTGATERAIGFCEAAAGGTLFLDEIGELPLPLQAKLLRFIQDRVYERVGARRTLAADARVMTATHRDLETMVGRGTFRADLYYRIKVVQLALPPLRQRGPQEILMLAEHFLGLYARKHRGRAMTFSEPARTRLCTHHWPGNVRELEHCVESAVVMCEGQEVMPEHLALPRMRGADPTDEAFVPLSLDEVERRHVERTLAHTAGNVARAARLLGVGRNTLYRKMQGWGLAPLLHRPGVVASV